ncbi:metallophosphoesterase family protein [Glycocaulis sp.]|uniref:metallophosphoesterase family protein n=1 Tax=Glycocaulis sp. TaxID=1969725 RepID=UPI003F6E49FC
MIRLFQLADLHFGTEDPGAMNAAAGIIADSAPAALMICGDLTQRGKRSEFEAARNWLDQFEVPQLVVPGNHDTPLLNAVSRVSRPFSRFARYFSDRSASLDIGPWRAAGLNSARGWQARSNWAEGSISSTQLRIALNEIGEQPGILVCHHPFKPPVTAPLHTRTARGIKASAMVAPSPVRLVLSGHVHGASADLHSYSQGSYLSLTAGTLSTRLREGQPSFSEIILSGDEIDVIAHRFDGKRFRAETLGQFKTGPDGRITATG